ncbi:MAG: ChaN family lipoprotein [Armatimonadetes bacterium]|nr:ChaN family lipoprotein [Armatimonadota bacterium]
MIPAALLITAASQTADPYQLPINGDRSVEVTRNAVFDTQTGKRATLEQIAEAADGKRFVYVGEEHDNTDAHRWQALIIGALVERGRRVIVGMEMYQRPKQHYLNLWTLGKLTEEEFIEESDWKGQWGFDYALYRPIFDYVRRMRLRLVALNVPREWVRTASREGYDALPDEAKAQLPEMYLGNEKHRRVFDVLMTGHPPGPALDAVYRGQVLWDEAMADSALKYLENTSVTSNTVFVILAGNGHLMYEQGINYRVKRRTGMEGVTVIPVSIEEGDRSRTVSAGLGDFVVGTRKPERDDG